ncbi:peptidylprolyl isomerase [Thiomonas sp.]|uniref:peptidylprolyl isomerase n=1 Tax=Thiomonas sp. TaxID=2047785 RepID=UPI0026167D9B|nr:peptidylprolyl isomerase [Thiomonas sp.]
MNKFLPRLALLAFVGAGLPGMAAHAQMTLPGASASPQGLQAPADGAAASSDGIAAVVGDQVITQYDLRLRVEDTLGRLARQQPGAPVPPVDQVRAQVLQQMIDEYALAEYAQQSGLQVGDDTLQRAVAQVASSNHMDVTQLHAKVVAQGMGWKDFEGQIRREILIQRLRQRDVAAKVSVTDQEVDDYLSHMRSLQGQIAPSEQLHLAQIFVPIPEQASAQVVAQARQIIDAAASALRQGRRFEVVAQQFSGGPEATHGGDLGTRPAGEWPDLFVNAVRNLQPGQVSEVIRSPAGFHILELVARQHAAQTQQTAMQAEVREIVLNADGDSARRSAVHELVSVRRAVLAGEVSFAAKAKEISQDLSTAAQGGSLGWVLPGQLPAALDGALDNLNPGQISEPLVLPGRVVLLQLVDRREHALGPGQERAVVRSELLQRKAEKNFQDLLRDVRERTYVRIPGDDS